MRSAAPPGSPHASEYSATAPAASDAQTRPSVPYPTRELLQQDRENRDFVYNLGFAVSVLEDMLMKFETTTRARLSELNNKAARLERLLTYVEFFVSGGAPADAELPFPTPPASPVASVQQQLSTTSSPRFGVPSAVASSSKAAAQADPPDITPPRDTSPRKKLTSSPAHGTSSPRHAHADKGRDQSRSRSARSPRSKERRSPRSPSRESRQRVHSSSPSRRVLSDDIPLHSSRSQRSRSRGRKENVEDSLDLGIERKAARRASPAKVRDSFTVNSSFQDWRPPGAGSSAAVSTHEEQVALRSSRKDELVNMDSDGEDSFDTQPMQPQDDSPESPKAIQWSRTMDNALYESLAFPGRGSVNSSVAWHATPRPALQNVAAHLASAPAAGGAQEDEHDVAESSYSRGRQELVDVSDGVGSRSVQLEAEASASKFSHAAPMAAAADVAASDDEDFDLQYGTRSLPVGAEHAVAHAASNSVTQPQVDHEVQEGPKQHAGADVWKANLRQIEEQLSGLGLQSSSLGGKGGPTSSSADERDPVAHPSPVPDVLKPPMPRPPHRALYHGSLQALQEEPDEEKELELQAAILPAAGILTYGEDHVHDCDAGADAADKHTEHLGQEFDASPLASQSSPIDPEGRSLPDTDVASICNTPSASYPLQGQGSSQRHADDDGMYGYGDFMLPLPYFLDAPSPSSHAATPHGSQFDPAEGDTPAGEYAKGRHVRWQAPHTEDTYSARSVGSTAAASAVVDHFLDEHLHRFRGYVPEVPKADDYPWDTEASLASPAPRVRAPLTASQGG